MSLLQLEGIVKRFGSVTANRSVSLSVEAGEIHALVGENGAGKTTLMNIVYGLYQPDEGRIVFDGKPAVIDSPKKSIRLGIGMVHQHFMLIPPFSAVENIVLGEEPGYACFFNKKEAMRRVREISGAYGLQVDPDALVSTLPVGAEQRIEILKLLYRNTRLMIFDEPTAVLTPQEAEHLFKILKKLRSEGKTIIFISHKLKEVKAVSDRITVMKQGEVAGVLETAKTSESEIARMMVGREVTLRVEKPPCRPGEKILEVRDLHAQNDRKLPALRGLSFNVAGGEIFGIAGVAGNGQTELVEALTGLRACQSGSIVVNGLDITRATAAETIRSGVSHIAGIAHVPEDRHKRGLILDYPVSDNLILGAQRKLPFSRNGILQRKNIDAFARERVGTFDIRPRDVRIPARALSGGNQQKAVIAREFSRNPVLLVAAQPTRGVDVGGIEFIHRQILSMRGLNKAIVLVSLELDEILALSDRVGVLYEGRFMKILPNSGLDEQTLGLLMAGVRAESGAKAPQ